MDKTIQKLYTSVANPNSYGVIYLLAIWQFCCVSLVAVGAWSPQTIVWSFILLCLFVLLASPFKSLLLLVLSIPFSVMVPIPHLPELPMWRLLFLLLFFVWVVRLVIGQRAWFFRVLSVRKSSNDTLKTASSFKLSVAITAVKRVYSRLMPWDKIALILFVISLLSLTIARFPVHGLKQVFYVLNIYMLYLVAIHVVTDQVKIKKLIDITTASLLIMLGWGIVQYVASLFFSPYYFWQYWATQFSGVYFGQSLANVLTYSNSWFSGGQGTQALRMFGILQDTHSFGVVIIFLLGFLLPKFDLTKGSIKGFISQQKKLLLVLVLVSAFAIMASGTRGVWLSMLGPLSITFLFIWKKFMLSFSKLALAVYSLIIALFILSPFISQGINLLRTYNSNDNFLGRVTSIYDLSETSNVGRLDMWHESLKYAFLHPFGVGFGNFVVSIVPEVPLNSSYSEVSSAKDLRYNLPKGFITAHSLYLQLLVELGLAGLLAFCLYWWEYFEQLFRFLMNQPTLENYYSRLSLSLGLAIIWLLTYGVFDVTILNDRVLQYLLMILAISGLMFTKASYFTERNTGRQT